MIMQDLLPGILLLFALFIIHSSTSSSPSYIGAVVEYRPVTEGEDGRKVAELNAAHVKRIVKKASEYNVDIIVFPEIGLTSLPENRSWTIDKIRAHHRFAASYIPEPEENVVLCHSSDRYSKSLKSVSCTAKEQRIYVVVNHHERVDCDPDSADCASDDAFLLYNTNVVFDREGRLIARYRKYNLFSEPGVNITKRPEISIFHTDFGVKFGQIICNDILYVNPARQLLHQYNVTDVVYSAEWFSELPFLTSVQTHSAWAFDNDVNLLSSGFNEPAITNGGSGIYLGKDGIVKSTIPNESANLLVVAEIPKIVNGRRQRLVNPAPPKVYRFSQAEVPTTWDTTEHFMYKDDFSVYTTEIVDPKLGSYSKKLCNRGLCCDFELEMDFDKNVARGTGVDYYRYRIGVFNGTRLFAGLFTVGIEVCGLFFCSDDTLASCGSRFTGNSRIVQPTTFRSVAIEREIDQNKQKFYLPMTLTPSLVSIRASKISFETSPSSRDETSKNLKMKLKKPETNLMTFAIYGRDLAKDGSELTRSSE
ncbi:vanin-like protein 2 [Nasonia vitripennis]|uniref:CN hydrolase domain-containing protein n=1 Tax=Nasonia vitripennis TaxID=7425 RepID=A0A7M7PY95_NASVI|nr:vanin-like protein 2 [Nasonia vitripennis]